MNIYRNTTTIVCYRDGVIFVYHYVNLGTKSGQCFVNRVVNNFVYQMVETFLAGIANIHGRSLTHCL